MGKSILKGVLAAAAISAALMGCGVSDAPPGSVTLRPGEAWTYCAEADGDGCSGVIFNNDSTVTALAKVDLAELAVLADMPELAPTLGGGLAWYAVPTELMGIAIAYSINGNEITVTASGTLLCEDEDAVAACTREQTGTYRVHANKLTLTFADEETGATEPITLTKAKVDAQGLPLPVQLMLLGLIASGGGIPMITNFL